MTENEAHLLNLCSCSPASGIKTPNTANTCVQQVFESGEPGFDQVEPQKNVFCNLSSNLAFIYHLIFNLARTTSNPVNKCLLLTE